jgi:hypothetical protein
MKVFAKIAVFNFLLMILACRDQYPLPAEVLDLRLLVVEGFLSGNGPTMVRLSRTSNPADAAAVVAETGAQVTVEGDDNTSDVLTGNNFGVYTNPGLNLIVTQKYRLKIITADGKEYHSDFVPVQTAPPIDSVHWTRTPQGVNLFVTTHDPQNKTRYYRWEYFETWEIQSAHTSNYEYRAPNVVVRQDPFVIYYCWRNDSSKSILLSSSASLSQDLISAQPLYGIQLGGERLSVRYSVLVKQYALTREAYQFWDILKKNTEQMGTLFDPQPSQVLSNVRSITDPTDPVIGFVSAGTFSEKRIFIREREVAPWPYRVDCEPRNIRSDSIAYYFSNMAWIPLDEWRIMGFFLGYTASTRLCVDCTVRGSPVKPSFW